MTGGGGEEGKTGRRSEGGQASVTGRRMGQRKARPFIMTGQRGRGRGRGQGTGGTGGAGSEWGRERD